MKKPYFNREQRDQIYYDALSGAFLKLHLETKKILRDELRDNGWLAMKKAERIIVKIANFKLRGNK